MAERKPGGAPQTSESLTAALSEMAAHPEIRFAEQREKQRQEDLSRSREATAEAFDQTAAGSAGAEAAGTAAAPAAEEHLATPEQIEEALASDVFEQSFRERVTEKIPLLRYANNLHRPIYTPGEQVRLKTVDRRAAFWMPLITFGALVLCAIASVALAVRIVGNDSTTPQARAITVVAIAGVLVLCFFLLLRTQDHWDHLRPLGRNVRTDVADAYETVRDAPFALVELGTDSELLTRVVELLPVAERLVDHLVMHEATSPMPVKGLPAYDELIRMAAEVHVITEMRQERLGYREPPSPAGQWATRLPSGDVVAGFQSLVDLAATIGLSPQERAEREAERAAAAPGSGQRPASEATAELTDEERAELRAKRVVDPKTLD